MLTYFARHTWKMDIDKPTRQRLWDERRIGIHYPHTKHGKSDCDTESLNPNDYQGRDRIAIKTLVNLAHSGGYICAQYQGFDTSLVGVIEPNSAIELLHGRWGDLYGYKDRTAIIKTLRLTRVKEVPPALSVAILVGRPRQGTLMCWPSAQKAIENIVEGLVGEAQLADLSDAQQEILCSEFLRIPPARQLGLPNLVHLLLPVGRTMKDIDIYGVGHDGKRIFAQVTFRSLDKARWKIDRLQPYRDKDHSHLILFCRTESLSVVEGVTVVPIQHVFAQFKTWPTGQQWFARLT